MDRCESKHVCEAMSLLTKADCVLFLSVPDVCVNMCVSGLRHPSGQTPAQPNHTACPMKKQKQVTCFCFFKGQAVW